MEWTRYAHDDSATSSRSTRRSSIPDQTTSAGYVMSHVFSGQDPIATVPISSAPEPASVALGGMGLGGMLLAFRARRPRSGDGRQ